MNDTFKENVILTCDRCVVKDECDLNKSGYCILEIAVYERFMKAIEAEYENVTEVQKMVAETLVQSLILANRVSRQIKLKGLTTKVKIVTPDGLEKEYDQENILKMGFHLDINRVIRLLKEMKLTPKEASPQKRQIDIREMIVNVSKRPEDGSKPVHISARERKRKVVLPTL